jgi:hypothetical protein
MMRLSRLTRAFLILTPALARNPRPFKSIFLHPLSVHKEPGSPFLT